MLRAHLMVAPIDHRERVVGDFSEDEYVELQRVVHQAGRALESVVETERLYVLSLGSQQGNRHVHWHLVPLRRAFPTKVSNSRCSAKSGAGSRSPMRR
jgi:diadenosine tetraphosphate (Ap4A) HIT family hydrolase